MRKTVCILILSIFAQATGNVFLSMRMKEIGSIPWSTFLLRALESPFLWVGTALLMVSFISFVVALSRAELSFVVPALAAEVVVNVIFARCFLNEAVSLTRWAGVLFISVGVVLVLRSERNKDNRGSSELRALGGR